MHVFIASGATYIALALAIIVGIYRYAAANGWGRPVLQRHHVSRRTAAHLLVRPMSLVEHVAKRQAKQPGSGALDYDPQRWTGVADSDYNCYGYAIDLSPQRVFPAPGRNISPLGCIAPVLMSEHGRRHLGYRDCPKGGWCNPTLTRKVLHRALLAEGLQKATWRSLSDRNCPRWLVAVGFDPYERDFHLWMLHRDGTWSNKPGDYPVTNRDVAGKPIRTPRRARTRNVYWFVGYYWVVPEKTAAYQLFTTGHVDFPPCLAP